MKKEYMKPAMEIVNIEAQYLLTVSTSFNDTLGEGLSPLFDEELEEGEEAW